MQRHTGTGIGAGRLLGFHALRGRPSRHLGDALSPSFLDVLGYTNRLAAGVSGPDKSGRSQPSSDRPPAIAGDRNEGAQPAGT